jgi:hypothetical protein
MADSQEIQAIVEGAVKKVFDRRIAEVRKDLNRGVGESLSARLSQLQSEIEQGVGQAFNSGLDKMGGQVAKSMGEALNNRVSGLTKEIEQNVTEVLKTRAAEIRINVEHGMTDVLSSRSAELLKQMETGMASAFESGVQEFQKEIDRLVTETTNKHLGLLRKQVDRVAEEVAEKRIVEMRKEVVRVVGEKTDTGITELRKDVNREVQESADKRVGELKQEAERIVREIAEQRVGDLRKEVERVVGEVINTRVADMRKEMEKVVAEAGTQRIEEMRKEVVQKVSEELEPALKGKAVAAPTSSLLDSSVASIQEAGSQTDILKALLDGAAHFASRVALFVIKGGAAAGWQARGFDNNNAIKKVSVNCESGSAERAIRSRMPVTAAAKELDSQFASQLGGKGNGWVVPLLVKDKVPGLIYADAGARGEGSLDTPALQLLVRSAGLWLEIQTLRKIAESSTTEEEITTEEVEDSAAGQEEAVQESPHASAAAAGASHGIAESEPAPSDKAEKLSPQDEDVLKKARRFAKLLVDEIKLYNQAKVNEGRQHKDLYNRLKEDIDKSRASYEKRYGGTVAAHSDFFTQEVIKVLAENDVSVLGNNFPR